ncbi:MAG TPA: TolC family protein [Chitinophagaceae bacterium]
MKQLLTLITTLYMTHFVAAQEKTFSESELLGVVKAYHPVARQAVLQVEEARAEVRIARGAFDPVLSTYSSRKETEGVLYYQHRQQEVRIPTWYGIEVRAGSESLTGDRTNPSDTRGSVSYVGMSVPLLRNLVMDKRRAVLGQAKLLQEASVADQQRVLNDLVYDALKAYRQWWQQHQLARLFREAMVNALKRRAMVQEAYRQGERPAIDTLEAYTQVQAFQLREAEIAAESAKAQLELSLFLWTEGGAPYELPPDAVPQAESPVTNTPLLENYLAAVQDHPELVQYRYKLSTLQLDRQLAFQSLLPSVNLHYNQLGKERSLKETVSAPWLRNNYRYGVSLSLPLRLSEGRGQYHKARLAQQGAQLEQLHKRASLETKVKQSFTQWQLLRRQLQVQQSAVQNYIQLQRGEEVKFFNGESSLFLVNSREAKTLEAREKLITLEAKESLALYGLRWAAGQLID